MYNSSNAPSSIFKIVSDPVYFIFYNFNFLTDLGIYNTVVPISYNVFYNISISNRLKLLPCTNKLALYNPEYFWMFLNTPLLKASISCSVHIGDIDNTASGTI